MRLARLLVCVLSLSACGSELSPEPTGPVDTAVILAPGIAADVEAAGVLLRFVAVTGDSRCPADAICIHAGDAIVRIDVRSDAGQPASYDLHTAGPRAVMYDDLRIELVALTPYPFTARPIDRRDYRATLRITR